MLKQTNKQTNPSILSIGIGVITIIEKGTVYVGKEILVA